MFASKGVDLLAKGDCWEENKVLSLELYSLVVEVDNIIIGNIDRMEEHSSEVLLLEQKTVHSWTSFEGTML
jgi:hypothetical protein